MESVINRIIDIDRCASERISDAKKRETEILEGTAGECAKITKELSAAADQRIAEVEKINKAHFELLSAELEKAYEQEIEEMDGCFESSHISIENAIFAEIVGE